MNNVFFIVMFVVVFIVLGGAGLYAKKLIDKTDPGVQNAVSDLDATTAQEFIPMVDIKDYMVDLGGNKYRAVLECSSVNYNLKTNLEREIIEVSFQNFISSLSHPITFHIQTKKIDNTLIVRELEKDLEVLKRKNPSLMEYGEIYSESIRGLGTYMGDSKQKKKYLIIPYDDASTMTNLSEIEKFEFALHQMKDRVGYIADQLSTMGIKTQLLGEEGLVDLIYNAYHRDSSVFDISEGIYKGEFFTSMVMGENKKSKMSIEQKLDFELLKIQNLMRDEFLGNGSSREINEKTNKIYEGLNALRDEVGRPYKSSYDKVYSPENGYTKSKNCISREECASEIDKEETHFDEIKEEKYDLGFEVEIEETKEEKYDLGFEVEVEESKDDKFDLGFEVEVEESKDDKFDLGFEVEVEESKDDKFDLGFEVEMEGSKEDEFDLGFEVEVEESKDDKFDLGFEVEVEESKDDKFDLGFEVEVEESKEDEFDLGFEVEMEETKEDIFNLGFEVEMEESKEDEFDLGFEVEMEESKEDEFDLGFEVEMEESKEEKYDLDFEVEMEETKEDIFDLGFEVEIDDTNVKESKKSNRINDLLMFD